MNQQYRDLVGVELFWGDSLKSSTLVSFNSKPMVRGWWKIQGPDRKLLNTSPTIWKKIMLKLFFNLVPWWGKDVQPLVWSYGFLSTKKVFLLDVSCKYFHFFQFSPQFMMIFAIFSYICFPNDPPSPRRWRRRAESCAASSLAVASSSTTCDNVVMLAGCGLRIPRLPFGHKTLQCEIQKSPENWW